MKIKSTKSSYLQLRFIENYEDDFSGNFPNTKRNLKNLLSFITLYDHIKPNGYKPIRVWKITTDRIDIVNKKVKT